MKLIKALLAAASFVAAAPASAALTLYTDQAAFTAAAASMNITLGVEDFSTAVFSPNLVTAANFSMTGIDDNGFFEVPSASTFPNEAPVTFTFGAPINALAFDLRGLGDNGSFSTLILTYAGGSTALVSDFAGAGGSLLFRGFIDSSASFTSATISSNNFGDYVEFDNIRYGAASGTPAVPEPATWAMMIVGFGLVGGTLRARRPRSLAAA